MARKHVDLGFAEKCNDYWRLLSHYFPSKLGGPPSWLSLSGVPGYDRLECSGCQKTCKFLLQIYSPAPLDECEQEEECEDDAFHRTLYVFVCAETSCQGRDLKCFRSQLSRTNEFYSSMPPEENCFDEAASYPKVSDFIKICQVCHCSATKTCAQCKEVSYCSKYHQALDWKTNHKQNCSKKTAGEAKLSHSKYFFDEFEIVIEEESVTPSSNHSEKERMKDYEKYIKSLKTDQELSTPAATSELQGLPEAQIGDSTFLTFRERVSDFPDQIIRYDRGGEPLLVSGETKPPANIPCCQRCGAKRVFEFQIMPQTLSYLNVDTSMDSLDWGTMLIYTCEKSCPISRDYADEFTWKQDFSSKDVVEGISRVKMS